MEERDFINRRKFYRINLLIPMCGDLTILSVNGTTVKKGFTPICIEDIGVGGVRCKSKLNIPVSDTVNFGVKFHLYERDYVMPSSIAWKRELRTGMFEYGFKFLISEEEREHYISMFNRFSVELANNTRNLYNKCDSRRKKCKYI